METETQDLLATLVQRSLGILSEVHSIERRIQALQAESRIAGMQGGKSHDGDHTYAGVLDSPPRY